MLLSVVNTEGQTTVTQWLLNCVKAEKNQFESHDFHKTEKFLFRFPSKVQKARRQTDRREAEFSHQDRTFLINTKGTKGKLTELRATQYKHLVFGQSKKEFRVKVLSRKEIQ